MLATPHCLFQSCKNNSLPSNHNLHWTCQTSYQLTLLSCSTRHSLLGSVQNLQTYWTNHLGRIGRKPWSLPHQAQGLESKMANFSQLPKELFLMVAECLPPLNLLALSQTCSSLRTILDVHIESVFHKTVVQKALGRQPFIYYWDSSGRYSIDEDSENGYEPAPRRSLSEENSQRLEFLFMLERDGQLSAQRLVCSRCVQTHERSLFSSETLQREPTKRNCLGWEGRLQICPHQALSYADILERPPIALCGSCGHEPNHWSIQDHGEGLWLHLHKTLTLGETLDLTMPNLTRTLKSRCIPFCPHTNSSDKNFLAWIHYHTSRVIHDEICEDCPANYQRGSYSSGYVGHHSCDTCGMRVRMSSEYQGLQYPEGIQISVDRDLGHTSTKPTDPQWIANVTIPLTKQVTIPSQPNSDS